MWFLSRKTTNNTTMYLLAPFLCKIKKDLEQYHFWANTAKLPRIRFFSEKPLIKFPCLSWPLSLCKILKQSWQWIQSCEDIWGPKWSICPKQDFFGGKAINIISMYLIAPFIVQNFKKTLRGNRHVPFLWPKWVICLKQKIFGKNH